MGSTRGTFDMLVCYEGKQGSGMALSAMRILYEESRRTGLPIYTNDWNTPYEHFDEEKFLEALNKLGKEGMKDANYV